MIGGNRIATFQLRTTATKNEIGELVAGWEDVRSLKGFLDYVTGDSKYNIYNAKVQESSHIFICDYAEIVALGSDWLWDEIDFTNSFINIHSNEKITIEGENSRMIIDGQRYDVMLIDDPMKLHKHLEIYLKFTGGQ